MIPCEGERCYDSNKVPLLLTLLELFSLLPEKRKKYKNSGFSLSSYVKALHSFSRKNIVLLMEAFVAARCCTVHTIHADLHLNLELKELGDFLSTVSFFTVNRTPLKTGDMLDKPG